MIKHLFILSLFILTSCYHRDKNYDYTLQFLDHKTGIAVANQNVVLFNCKVRGSFSGERCEEIETQTTDHEGKVRFFGTYNTEDVSSQDCFFEGGNGYAPSPNFDLERKVNSQIFEIKALQNLKLTIKTLPEVDSIVIFTKPVYTFHVMEKKGFKIENISKVDIGILPDELSYLSIYGFQNGKGIYGSKSVKIQPEELDNNSLAITFP